MNIMEPLNITRRQYQHQYQYQYQYQHQQEQELLQHPYMSLYEPLFQLQTGPNEPPGEAEAEADACPSSLSSSQQRTRPEEVSSSSSAINAAVTTTTTSTNANRAKKRRKITPVLTTSTSSSSSLLTSIHDAKWMEMYQRLVVYKKEHHGDTKVPIRYEDDPKLGKLVDGQRTAHKRKKIPEKRECKELPGEAEADADACPSSSSLLASIRDAKWMEMYQRLVVYKKEHHGDTKVPIRCKEDPKLGKWVDSQRTAHKRKKIPEKRKRLLDSVGFVWSMFHAKRSIATWEDMYERLIVYKKEYKDTIVPIRFKEDPKLGTWVRTQCAFYRNKRMTEERKRKLQSIGFVWSLRVTTTTTATATATANTTKLIVTNTTTS